MNECQAKELARAAIGELNQGETRSELKAPQVPLNPGPLHTLFPLPETFAPTSINAHSSLQGAPSSREPSLTPSWVRCSPTQPPGLPNSALTSAGLSLSVIWALGEAGGTHCFLLRADSTDSLRSRPGSTSLLPHLRSVLGGGGPLLEPHFSRVKCGKNSWFLPSFPGPGGVGVGGLEKMRP